MNANRGNDSFPTAQEEQALAETREHFTEHLNQFSESQAEIRRIEKDLSRLALAVNLTTSRTAPSRIRFQTDDGASWYASVELMHNCWKYCTPVAIRPELAPGSADRRKRGLALLVNTLLPNKLNSSILNEVSEFACCRLQQDKALNKAGEYSFDLYELNGLPYLQFVDRNLDSDGELRGQIKV